ncbi:MAG: methyltransferase domain-containing protein [Gammaproteobacteria bacterium]
MRNDAVGAALARVLKPGMTVADIGAGTGFLSFLARRLGAAHCHLYEYTGALALARELARRNGITGLSFVEAHSTEVRKPPRVDVVISETLGNYALEEGLLETMVDARRFLKPGGVMLPCALRQFVAPVIAPRIQDEIDVFARGGHGLDLAPAREAALNNMYVRSVAPHELAGEATAREWDRVAFVPEGKPPSSQRKGLASWPDLGGKTVHGFALWWEIELVEGVSLSTSPYARPTHWEQVYLPLLEPVKPARGQQLDLSLTSNTRVGVRLVWETRLRQAGKGVSAQRQDLARGRL